MKNYVATIQIVFEAEDETDAEDVVSAIFTDGLQQEGTILNWAYLQLGQTYTYPVQDIGALHKWQDQ